MKKTLCILIALLSFSVASWSQERQKISDGVYMVTYGNTTVIEDDIHQQTLQLQVVKSPKGKNSAGQQLYDFVCGNKVTKDLTKTTMKRLITTALTSLGTKIGASSAGLAGGAAGAAIGAIVADYANVIASNLYDSACEYFNE